MEEESHIWHKIDSIIAELGGFYKKVGRRHFSNSLSRSLARRQSSERTGKQRVRVNPGSQVNKLFTGYLSVLFCYCLLSLAD